MSMNVYQVKVVISGICISMLLSGCASTNVDITPVVFETDTNSEKGHQVTTCNATQRDLTIPWSLRQYWCGEDERTGALQNINNNVLNRVAGVDQAYLDEINKESNRSQYDAPKADKVQPADAVAPSLNREDEIKRLKSNRQSSKENTAPVTRLSSTSVVVSDNSIPKAVSENIASTSNRNSVSKHSIVFAQNLRILGPQGRKATHALIDRVSGSDQVLIRGLILPDEILVDSALYREKVSVGRALAVRNYWLGQGLDISHIKILHHSPDLVGRSVEVVING